MRHVVLVCVAIFPLLVCSGIVYTILSLYMADLGFKKSQIGLLYTVGALAGAIASPLFGKLADRIGRKPVLLGAMSAFVLVFGGFAFVAKPEHMFLVMLLEGTAWGAMGTSANALVADLVPQDKRGAALGVYNTAWNLGWIIGPVTGGMLSDVFGFRKTFLLAAAFIVCGVLLGLGLLPSEKGLSTSEQVDEPF